MNIFEWFLASVYLLAGCLLFLYGLNCYWQVFFFLRGRAFLERQDQRAREVEEKLWRDESSLPVVTTQIPLYNEFNVAERIMRAVASIDYPLERHQIQVLDDSNDETCAVIDRVADALREEGHWVDVFRRENREGFKAGALKAGLEEAKGEFVSIFDGDFVPKADFLRKTLPLLLDDFRLGLVQGRWSHLNPKENILCRAQSVGIDGHFSIEQSARSSNGLFFNFNGTAGVWRKETIYDCGNWEGDTLTEDMDLSYRAQLAGWRFAFKSDAVVPAELPSTFTAFKNQQFRWAKGSIQTAKKLFPRVWRSGHSLVVRIQALLHMTHYAIHPVTLTVALLSLPILFILPEELHVLLRSFGVAAILVAALGPNSLYLVGQRHLYPETWPKRVVLLPLLTVIGLGISVSNSRGVISGIFGKDSEFVRTPKKGSNNAVTYRAKASWVVGAEIFLGFYCMISFILHVYLGIWGISPFLFLYTIGYLFVGFLSLWEIIDFNPRRLRSNRRKIPRSESQTARTVG
ncbi:MAG: glycosyltransferase [Verrucomicrobiota bacterium]